MTTFCTVTRSDNEKSFIVLACNVFLSLFGAITAQLSRPQNGVIIAGALMMSLFSSPIAQAQTYLAGRLTVILTDAAIAGMSVNASGIATLPNAGSLNTLNSSKGCRAMHPMSRKPNSAFKNFFELEFDTTANLTSLKASYAANSLIKWVSEIPNETPRPLGSGPYYPTFDRAWGIQWHLNQNRNSPDDNLGYTYVDSADVNAPEAWQWTLGDTNVVIAVCGGGVRNSSTDPYTYLDVVSNLWKNRDEIPNNGIDDDGNGFIDDINGWSFFGTGSDISMGGYAIDHGTACAYYAGAALDSVSYPWNIQYGWVGMAPKCRLMIVGAPTTSSIVYATDNGATAFSHSWVIDSYAMPYWKQYVDAAYSGGMLFVNALGNLQGSVAPSYQVGYYGVSVAAINEVNKKTSLSSYNDSCRISAPHAFWDGVTSMSAPIVAGVVGLMKSVNKHLTAPQLREILLSPLSVNPINDPLYTQHKLGAGRTDAYKAVRNASAMPIMNGVSVNNNAMAGSPRIDWSNSTFRFGMQSQSFIVSKKINDGEWIDVATLAPSSLFYVDPSEPNCFTENGLIFASGTTFRTLSYRVRAVYTVQSETYTSIPSDAVTIAAYTAPGGGGGSTSDRISVSPGKTRLAQNYPNPFNPSTVISYSLPQAAGVSLRIYDMLGREVATLVNERKTAGSYDAKFDGSRLASGVYFYTLVVTGSQGSFKETKKLLLTK